MRVYTFKKISKNTHSFLDAHRQGTRVTTLHMGNGWVTLQPCLCAADASFDLNFSSPIAWICLFDAWEKKVKTYYLKWLVIYIYTYIYLVVIYHGTLVKNPPKKQIENCRPCFFFRFAGPPLWCQKSRKGTNGVDGQRLTHLGSSQNRKDTVKVTRWCREKVVQYQGRPFFFGGWGWGGRGKRGIGYVVL